MLTAIVAVTVAGTIWTSLGAVGQALIVAATACAAIGYLIQKIVRPVVRTVAEASQAYRTLAGVEEKLDGFLARVVSIEERVAHLEARIAQFICRD